MKKVLIAFALGIILLAPSACSKRTETVQPTDGQTTVKHTNKSTNQTYAEQLAADADFRAGASLLVTISSQTHSYLESLNSSQRNALNNSFNSNPTEANLLSLFIIDENDYNSMNHYIGTAIDRISSSASLTGTDLDEVVNDAYRIYFGGIDPYIIRAAWCFANYVLEHYEIGKGFSTGKFGADTANEKNLANLNNYRACAMSILTN